MFFIYSLQLDTLIVKLYDFCRTKDGVDELLDTVARNFIRRERGERHAESPYRDDLTDVITDEGYFLRHSADNLHQIDVYLRKTNVITGRVWNSYDVSCKKVMQFAVSEAALGLPIECTGRGVTRQTFSSSKEAKQQSVHFNLLKERLVQQREKVDNEIAIAIPLEEYHIIDACDESDNQSDEECPLEKLLRGIEDMNSGSADEESSELEIPPQQDGEESSSEGSYSDLPTLESIEPIEPLWSCNKRLCASYGGTQTVSSDSYLGPPSLPPLKAVQAPERKNLDHQMSETKRLLINLSEESKNRIGDLINELSKDLYSNSSPPPLPPLPM